MSNFSSNFDFLFFSETWQRIDDEFELDGYESILVPRVESINNSSKRGHGGIALFYKKCLKPGINTVEKILVDLSVLSYVNYTFSLSLTYMCVVHIPPSNYHYLLSHHTRLFEMLESKVGLYCSLCKC